MQRAITVAVNGRPSSLVSTHTRENWRTRPRADLFPYSGYLQQERLPKEITERQYKFGNPMTITTRTGLVRVLSN
jgi:hypothetical protein